MGGTVKPLRLLLRKVAIGLAIFLICIMVLLGIVSLAVVGLLWEPDACTTETRKKLPNLSGFDFEINETDCSGFGAANSISLFVSPAGGHEKSLLFKYDPGGDGPLPSIVVSDQGNISISIAEVSSIYSQIRRWKNSSVEYHIGYVIFPDPVDTEKKPK